MVIQVSAWIELILWSNLILLLINMITVMGIRRDREKLNRMIIALVENRRKR